MGREIYDIINDMAEVLNAPQMQKLQEMLVKRLSENTVSDYLQTTNMDFLDMFLTAKHLEGCSDKTIRYYRCNIEKMLDTINIPVIKITTEMLRKYLVEYQTINNCGKVTIISLGGAETPSGIKIASYKKVSNTLFPSCFNSLIE